jgi:hypothetical protein
MKVNASRYAVLMNLLLDGTRTCRALADETGLSMLTVYNYTHHLHKAGAIHIAAWVGKGKHQTRIYAAGKADDAPRPSKTRRQISADYRARHAAKGQEQAAV